VGTAATTSPKKTKTRANLFIIGAPLSQLGYTPHTAAP
jgi:hypothetical protein